MSVTYASTYTVKDRFINSDVNPTAPLSAYTHSKTYAMVTYNGQNIYVDVSAMLLKEKNINYAQTLNDFLVARLTDIAVAGYQTEDLPFRDPATDKYQSRIESYDAVAASDMTISYSSITDPTVRNDPYQRGVLNDLVFSSVNRDLSNTLVSVNGVFHATQLYNKELFALDGFSNLKNSEPYKLIGMYDTSSLGGHTTHPIALDNIINTTGQDPTKGLYLQFPDLNFLNKTLMLVIGGYLYAFDNSFLVISKNTIKVNINRMDLIYQWLHNPNTEYYQQFGDLATNVANSGSSTTDTSGIINPSVREKMVYFLQTLYPEIPESEHVNVMLDQYKYSSIYSYIEKIEAQIPYNELTAASFVYKILASQHSFLVLINNPNVFVKRYPLVPTVETSQYETISTDFPRGMLRWNKSKVFPYVIYSSNSDTDSQEIPYSYQSSIRQHTISLGYYQKELDTYKKDCNPNTVVSPFFDPTSFRERFPVELMEVFSA